MNLLNITSKFAAETEASSIKPFGAGHINDSYFIRGKSKSDYLLQRINDKVFRNVPGLMNNIRIVLAHMRNKLQTVSGARPDNEVLSLIPTNDGAYFHKDESGEYWRMYKFIANTKSIDVVETKAQAYEGGIAIGKFQTLLSDLDNNLLTYTIPHFHNVDFRISQLRDSIENNTFYRKEAALADVNFALERVTKFSAIAKLWKEDELPLRITHNDTKFNNILFNQDNLPQCLIDLDTVMPGYVAYDFGDAIRTIINSASEDEACLSKIKLNMELFEAFTEGYLKESVVFLTDLEIASLPLSVMLFPYMQGIRFLTDHLNGDSYYKIAFPGHNLQRARAQFELLRKIEAEYAVIESVIFRVAKGYKLIDTKP